jgi:hypothetical protein
MKLMNIGMMNIGMHMFILLTKNQAGRQQPTIRVISGIRFVTDTYVSVAGTSQETY